MAPVQRSDPPRRVDGHHRIASPRDEVLVFEHADVFVMLPERKADGNHLPRRQTADVHVAVVPAPTAGCLHRNLVRCNVVGGAYGERSALTHDHFDRALAGKMAPHVGPRGRAVEQHVDADRGSCRTHRVMPQEEQAVYSVRVTAAHPPVAAPRVDDAVGCAATGERPGKHVADACALELRRRTCGDEIGGLGCGPLGHLSLPGGVDELGFDQVVAPEALGVAPVFVPPGPGELNGHVDHVGDAACLAGVQADELREPPELGAGRAGEAVDGLCPPHQVGLSREPAPLQHAGGGGHPAVKVPAEAPVWSEVTGALDHVARDPVTERHRLVVASACRQVLHDRAQDRGSRAHRAGADRLGVTVPPASRVEQLIGILRAVPCRHRVVAGAVPPHRDACQSVDECVDPPAQAGTLCGVRALLVAGHERHQAGALSPEFGHRRTRSPGGTGREVGRGYPA